MKITQRWKNIISRSGMNKLGVYKSLLLASISLLFMASSCPMQYDPFDSSGNNVGSLGFYINGSPVVYRAESAMVKEIEGTDSLMITSGFILGHYDQLTIKFAKSDITLDTPIIDPEIKLTYLYSIFMDMSNPYSDKYEWRTLSSEHGCLSFSDIGNSSGSKKDVLVGTFSFEGVKQLKDGRTETIYATDGAFNLEVSSQMIN